MRKWWLLNDKIQLFPVDYIVKRNSVTRFDDGMRLVRLR